MSPAEGSPTTPNLPALTVADLNTEVNCEPRVLDTVLGTHLGMARPTNIRSLIETSRGELEGFGSLHAARAMVAIGSGAKRGVNAYYLTEGQALCICALSRAPKAPQVRRMLIEAFMELRRQQLRPQQPRLPPKPRFRAFFARGLRSFPVLSDNMEPTLRRGDFALVQYVDRYEGDGVYVVGLDYPNLRRVDAFGGKVRIWSDNPRYSRQEVSREWFNANVVAKVVFAAKCLDRSLVPEQLRH